MMRLESHGREHESAHGHRSASLHSPLSTLHSHDRGHDVPVRITVFMTTPGLSTLHSPLSTFVIVMMVPMLMTVTMVMMHVRRSKIRPAVETHALAVDKHVGHGCHIVDAVQRCGGMDDFEQIEQGQADALFTRQQSPAVGCGIHIFRHKLCLVELMG